MTHYPQAFSDRGKQILDELFTKYYKNFSNYSAETSSHWRKYGDNQVVTRKDNDYQLSGVGFGDYQISRRHRMLPFLNLPSKLYINRMLRDVEKATIECGKWFARENDFKVSFDLARQLLTIDLLNRHIPHFATSKVCIIGDGYGTLGTLIKKRFPQTSVVFVNLGRTLFFDVYYTTKCFPNARVELLGSTDIRSEALDFSYIEAETVLEQRPKADVFINIASMQEMDPTTIGHYFSIIRSQKEETFFYCCNRVSKSLPDGSIIEFDEYDWKGTDQVIVDELCPWHQRFPINRPPFTKLFDGPIQHRLICITKPVPPQP